MKIRRQKQIIIVVISSILIALLILVLFNISSNISNSSLPRGTFLLKAEYPDDLSLYENYIVWSEAVLPFGVELDRYKIYLYNVSSGEKTSVIEEPIYSRSVAIFEDKIVWSESRDEISSINMYNISTKVKTKLDSDYGYRMDMYKDNIVWVHDSDPSEIYLYNISTGEKRQITPTGANQAGPSIYQNHVVWKGDNGILLYDIETQTITKLISNLSYNREWDISIYQDKIVYGDYHFVYLYNLTTNTNSVIHEHARPVESSSYFRNLEISGNYILINDYTEGPMGSYIKNWVYNLETGEEAEIKEGWSIHDDKVVSPIQESFPLSDLYSIYLLDINDLF